MPELTYGTPEEAGMDRDRIARLCDRAPELVDGFRARSAVMLAARRGKIFYHEAFGPLTDKTDSPPMLKDSVFSISSVSKPFTATAIMMLVEDGLLGLNRPIKEYLPEVCGEGTDDVEVQHLLNHTSGYGEMECWAHFYQEIDKHIGDESKTDLQKYLAATWNKDLDRSVGAQVEYDNHAYALLAEIINRASGMPVGEYIKSRIFDPLGMDDSRCGRDPGLADRQMVRGPNTPFGSHARNPYVGNEDPWLAGSYWGFMGINSTASDLARFGQMMLDGGIWNDKRLLSRPTIHEMTRSQTSGLKIAGEGVFDGHDASFGHGWFVQTNQRWPWLNGTLTSIGSFAHGGAGGHMLWVDPVNDIVGVYLSVGLDIDFKRDGHRVNADLFQNLVTAAVID